ncbi:hypothetical protein LOK74_15685 [Brevibacillus humidisoli]|uniref:hypothetical protein n=1 Tax=Brevibacillus humidisoli TaxID=2895522 RepID=UPI001E337E4C|nr:hypothetical protein [Brevibacillus humidisoli]UFJ39490.1 hypothetical protein LOK74_15685 [Brevibacillus humidisoli]
MKNVTVVFFLALALLLGIAACSDQTETPPHSEHSNAGETTTGQPDGEQSNREQPSGEQVKELDISYVKENLKQGLSQDEVKKLFGDKFTKVKSAMDNTDMWRYDFGAREGYQSPDDQYDTVDVEGIKNGELEMIVFVGWTIDGRVDTFSAYYMKKSDGNVYDYRVLPNGEVKEQAI